MTRDKNRDDKSPSTEGVEDAADDATAMFTGDERLLESLRHELAKQELHDYEPTREELREAEADVRILHARINERRRENLLADAAAAAVELPRAENLIDKSREWLLARLAELRELGRALPGGVQFAHRNLDAQVADDVSTEELRTQVADLEAAIAGAMTSTR